LASRAMICTISSRASPLPPGNWWEARSTIGAATAVPARQTAASAARSGPRDIAFMLTSSS